MEAAMTDWAFGTVLRHPGIRDTTVMFLCRPVCTPTNARLIAMKFTGVWLSVAHAQKGVMEVGMVSDEFGGQPSLLFTWEVVS
jgi:hypothetical protein